MEEVAGGVAVRVVVVWEAGSRGGVMAVKQEGGEKMEEVVAGAGAHRARGVGG